MFGNFLAQTTHICGCYYVIGDSNPFRSNRRYLPQVKLASYTTIGPLCFTTIMTQTFSNPCDEVIDEARYTFPLYDGVAVNGYTISYAGKVLKGVVKQKDDAKQTYQEAVERGETAGLLESLPAGIFGVTLSNVPAKGDVVVEITYCGELKHDAAIDGLRYTLPTSIAPRYGSYPGEVLHSNAQASGGISITVDVDMVSSAIRKVQSPSHPIAVSSGSLSTAVSRDAFKPHQASASLTLGTTELAQDFVLQLLVDDVDKPRAMLETHPTLPNQRAIMATMVPSFTLEPAHPEIVFIADQSGSMEGIKNAALVKALKIFLKSLPLGICFNICAFGNHFKYLWPQSQAYTASNLQQAVDFVETFSAAYGGTQILQPIVAAFEQRLDDMPLEVILLTDGQVWREEDVFKYINEHVHEKKVDARVFALGIGDGVSHTLVEGVARAGNGFAQFVTPGEEITGMDRKVVRMLKGALYAHTKDYRLEVVYAEDGDAGATRNCSASSASSDGTLTPGVGETDDDFELVEKFGSGLQLEEKDAVGPAVDEKDEKPTMSFFDSSADLDKPVNGGQDGAKRYAHLPAIDPPALLQAPPDIPPLFPFNRTTVYLLLGPEAPQKRVTAVVLRATSAEGSLELTVPVDYVEGSNAIPAVHQLAARKAIRDLEEGRGWLSSATITSDGGQTMTIKERYRSLFDELTEREAVRLGEKFQVAGKWTSFAAVQEGTEETSPQTAAEGTARRPRSAGGILRMDTKAEAMQACMDPGNYQVDQAIQHAKTKRSIGSSISSAAKATAIALAFLSFRAADQRDVWDMVADKATAWLKQETGLNGGGI
ncbi:hypothetical protein B0A55_11309 [Friedmanniomyces simplex]|uniref:VIT domain-containing protein n=1 Tax=Friedmanniomyces simplex TaxID=329884 RepID=A0A4U0WS55_9PEZI|nr:hypothetical protein B0A55_11309 [Friedmanniomyces simplex]